MDCWSNCTGCYSLLDSDKSTHKKDGQITLDKINTRKCINRKMLEDAKLLVSHKDTTLKGKIDSLPIIHTWSITQAMKPGAHGAPAYRTFSLKDIDDATNNFDTSTFIDTGSYSQEAVGMRGLKDDTTCIVVDLQAPEKSPLPPPRKQGISAFKSMLRRKSSESPLVLEKDYNELEEVEELIEEGSTMLSERSNRKYPICNMFKLFMCVVCQVEMKLGDDIFKYIDQSNAKNLRPWDRPFLCSSCQEKKEVMEGRRPSG